jgi:hypothetical protein
MRQVGLEKNTGTRSDMCRECMSDEVTPQFFMWLVYKYLSTLQNLLEAGLEPRYALCYQLFGRASSSTTSDKMKAKQNGGAA